MLATGNLTLAGMARELQGELRFTLPGQPITKKNSQEIVLIPSKKTPGVKRPIIVPSEAYRNWAKGLGYIANSVHVDRDDLPIDSPVWVCALVYCQTRGHGDLNNYTAALADWLENVGILKNDKLILSWDGSRVRVDSYKPRIDVCISAFTE